MPAQRLRDPFLRQSPPQPDHLLKVSLHLDAPDQSWLAKTVNETPSPQKYREAFDHLLRVGRDGLGKVFHDNGLDLVIAPMDSPACSMGTASSR